jgi:hypothetical protein
VPRQDQALKTRGGVLLEEIDMVTANAFSRGGFKFENRGREPKLQGVPALQHRAQQASKQKRFTEAAGAASARPIELKSRSSHGSPPAMCVMALNKIKPRRPSTVKRPCITDTPFVPHRTCCAGDGGRCSSTPILVFWLNCKFHLLKLARALPTIYTENYHVDTCIHC